MLLVSICDNDPYRVRVTFFVRKICFLMRNIRTASLARKYVAFIGCLQLCLLFSFAKFGLNKLIAVACELSIFMVFV